MLPILFAIFRPRDLFWNGLLVLWLNPEGFSQWVMTIAFLILLAIGRLARRGALLQWGPLS